MPLNDRHLSLSRSDISAAVLEAMQHAEEIGGPEDEEYSGLMADIADEGLSRLEGFFSHSSPTDGDRQRLVELRERLDTLCNQSGVPEREQSGD